MSWYQCSCGFVTEETPLAGDTIVSVHHLHRSARVDGSGAIIRMEEIPALPNALTLSTATECGAAWLREKPVR